MQVVYAVLMTKTLERAPIFVWHAEPLRISRTNIDVDGAKVVVLLMSGSSRARDFHVKLYCVHAQDLVTDVG